MPAEGPTLLDRSKQGSKSPLWRSQLFEQYKLYVASAHKVSDRRATANNYMLTVNSAMAALYGMTSQSSGSAAWSIVFPGAGILMSLVWWRLLVSYRALNSVKFAIIQDLERCLPAAPYTYEWHLTKRAGKAYRPLSHLEYLVPFIFMALYAVLIAFPILGWHK